MLAPLACVPQLTALPFPSGNSSRSPATSRQPAEPAELPSGDLASRVQDVVAQIEASAFTGKGDKEAVPNLYKGYVEGIIGVLQRTLAFAGATSAAAVTPITEMAAVALTPLSGPFGEPAAAQWKHRGSTITDNKFGAGAEPALEAAKTQVGEHVGEVTQLCGSCVWERPPGTDATAPPPPPPPPPLSLPPPPNQKTRGPAGTWLTPAA